MYTYRITYMNCSEETYDSSHLLLDMEQEINTVEDLGEVEQALSTKLREAGTPIRANNLCITDWRQIPSPLSKAVQLTLKGLSQDTSAAVREIFWEILQNLDPDIYAEALVDLETTFKKYYQGDVCAQGT